MFSKTQVRQSILCEKFHFNVLYYNFYYINKLFHLYVELFIFDMIDLEEVYFITFLID